MSLENIENFNEIIDEQDVDDQFDLTHFYLKALEDTADQGESLHDFLRGLAHVRGEYVASSEDLTELRRFLGLESREVSEEFVASEELARSESLESAIDEYRISVEGSIRSDIFDILERFDEGSEYFGEEPIGIKGFEPIHPLARLTDDEIVKILDKLRTDIKRLQLENQIYLDVLKQEDSSIFENAENFVEIKLNKQNIAEIYK